MTETNLEETKLEEENHEGANHHPGIIGAEVRFVGNGRHITQGFAACGGDVGSPGRIGGFGTGNGGEKR